MQFYNGLSQSDIDLLEGSDDISYDKAVQIFNAKNYTDPPMRGRNSFKVLQKFGFVDISSGKVSITESGHAFLSKEANYGEFSLRALLKWQLPNPIDIRGFPVRHGYNIKPFVGTLHLIEEVNRLCEKNKVKQKGLSFSEFAIFVPTLIDWKKIKQTAQEVFKFREVLDKTVLSEKAAFIERETQRLYSSFKLDHLQDYADNAIRYFRMTGYICIRGAGNYVDIDPLRRVEVDSLLKRDSAEPDDYETYPTRLGNPNIPELPGESPEELRTTILRLCENIVSIGGDAEVPSLDEVSTSKLKSLRDHFRKAHLDAFTRMQKKRLAEPNMIRTCATDLRNLTATRKRPPDAAATLERLSKEGLDALNDALEICGNYPAGEDGMPTAPAPAGKPDIVCRYDGFSAICEVTLLCDSKQWVHEGQPVVRHLRVFEDNTPEKETFCLFIAPKLHQDTLNTFHISVRHGYEGRAQKIAPITVDQFCDILDHCADRREQRHPLTRADIRALLSSVSESLYAMETSKAWQKSIPEIIEEWKLRP